MNDQPEVTLSERLAQGPLPAPEAQRIVAALADALRRLHDRGALVGALEPSKIMLGASGVRIAPGAPGNVVTPYSAPEQLQGGPTDARCDIFAFGAIVHELLSGRQAFAGNSPDEIRAAILEREPAPLPAEHAEYARVTSKCLAKAPLQRWQRMQRAQMELKLLTVFARRSEQDGALKTERIQSLVQAGVAEMESRLDSRLAAQDEKLRAAAETEQALRAEIAALEARLVSGIDAHEARLNSSDEAARAVSARLAGIDQALKAHSSSIESAESAIAQTDDLVERVVEAFDSLEGSLTDQNELKLAVGKN